MNRRLDDALRALPRREGRSDWNDLEARLASLKPARPPRRRGLHSRQILSLAGICLLVAGGALAWRALRDRPETLWQEAHQAASASDPWADPWVAAAVETSR